MKYCPTRLRISTFVKRLYSSRPTKNHYDSLKISPKATQNEVKSAYFQLSKLYHPDINNSDEAKEKFRDISEAYETLGNHERRKQYDRHFNIRAPSIRVPNTSYVRYQNYNMSPDELQREAQRVKTEFSRRNDGFPLHNMETWTKEHYGRIFHDTMEKKYRKEARKKEIEEAIKNSESLRNAELIQFSLMIICIAVLVGLQSYLMDSVKPSNVDPYNKKNNK